MNVSRNQHTIASSCEISGRGYWSGRLVHVLISPASAGTGVQLIRSDLDTRPACQALVTSRVDVALRTNVQSGAAKFEMIEHLMAALYALEIDNCYVEIDGQELPGLDGSSQPYVEALQHCGLIVQAKPREQLLLNQIVRVAKGGQWVEARPAADRFATFEYRLSFDDQTPIMPQTYSFKCTPGSFAREVAAARTFVTQQQAAALRAKGIASHVTNQDLLVFGESGPIDNSLRYENECARHKTLDLVGDLALAGVDLIADVISFRGGHILNGQLARKLFDMASGQPENASQSRTRDAA